MSAEPGTAVRWTLLVSTVFVLQIGVVVDLQILGVHPELMLLVAICAGLVAGPVRGASVGFAAGLLTDVARVGPLGTWALALALVGFGVGSLGDALLRASKWMSVAIAAAASAAGILVYASIDQLLGERTLTDPRLVRIVAIVALTNAVLCVPMLALCRWAESSELRQSTR